MSTVEPPKITPEPGWQPFTLPFDIGSGRSMFVETRGGPTIRMGFFRREQDGALVGRVWFGKATFGPPGHVHGGLIAYVIDEAMGSAAWLAGYPCLAANVNVDFLRMTPLGRDILVESAVVDVKSRRLGVEAQLSLDDRTLVKASGVFVRLRQDQVSEFSRDNPGAALDLERFRFAP